MRKLPRSLRFYVAASTLYAAVVFFAVQFIYTIQLTQSGILVAERDSGDVLSSIQIVSFIVWLGISLIAAAVMHRLATELAGAKSAEEEAKIAGEQKEQELGSIFGLSAAVAGPLDLEQIGGYFVAAIRGALPTDMTLALIVYDDVLEAFRTVAADGPRAATLQGKSYSTVALPAVVRTRVIDHRQSLLLADDQAHADMWKKIVEELPALATATSFAALPLVSRERLVGALLLIGEGIDDLIADKVQLPMIMGQYVAGSIHSALSVKEADPRAAEDVIQQDVIAAAATPIRVGGQLAGALSFSQVDRSREWTADDVRLIEAVAQELRVAITAAEAFERQRAAVAELEGLNRAKSDFVSIVSHEFRTPLTGIQGFSEMMAGEDLTLEEMREYAGDINKDAHRLNRMITEMLDLDKMESGRMQLHREPLDLNAIVSDAVDHMRPNAPRHAVSVRLDPLVGEMNGDRDKLTQVMANLLSNAVKYSPNGGEIVVSTRAERGAAHVVVRDHGMGIPKASLEAIFERYGRVESLATRHIQGTGLGLPIVRQIVQLHGGTVWAESSVGEGSVFHVRLPRGAALISAAAEAAS